MQQGGRSDRELLKESEGVFYKVIDCVAFLVAFALFCYSLNLPVQILAEFIHPRAAGEELFWAGLNEYSYYVLDIIVFQPVVFVVGMFKELVFRTERAETEKLLIQERSMQTLAICSFVLSLVMGYLIVFFAGRTKRLPSPYLILALAGSLVAANLFVARWVSNETLLSAWGLSPFPMGIIILFIPSRSR